MRYALASLLLTMVALGSESAIRQHYSRLQSFSAELVNAEGQRFRLLAARGKRFRLEAPEYLLVCDGTTLWSYYPARRQALRSRAPDHTGELEELLLQLLQRAELRILRRSGDTVELRVEPLHGGAEWFQGALLWLRRSDWAPLRVELSTAMGPQRWQVRNFRANPALSPDTFRFRPPPGTEVLELGQ